ncbi:NAD(P)H-dependent oxidoreductase [Bacillus sp. FJAT-29790]|nr:NAD(P)H-dependent oxidoreductase [Bacillus sp. FJAT-29790]MBU8877763.1 NAD(P)H-dependent oxidoreductase [Bacillus sp. FJAT-29790]
MKIAAIIGSKRKESYNKKLTAFILGSSDE